MILSTYQALVNLIALCILLSWANLFALEENESCLLS